MFNEGSVLRKEQVATKRSLLAKISHTYYNQSGTRTDWETL